MRPPIPAAAIEANTDKQSIWKTSDPSETSRRTIYAFIKRGLVVPMLEVLDLADTVHSCPQRPVTTVAPQALALFNNDFITAQSAQLAARAIREAGPAAIWGDASLLIDRSERRIDPRWHRASAHRCRLRRDSRASIRNRSERRRVR